MNQYIKEQKRIEEEVNTQKKPVFYNFHHYQSSFPNDYSESFKQQYKDALFLPTYSSCWIGNYYSVTVYSTKNAYLISVYDGDDGYAQKECLSLRNAFQEINNLILLSPFHYSELSLFNYKMY